jgi:hypothetical protein
MPENQFMISPNPDRMVLHEQLGNFRHPIGFRERVERFTDRDDSVHSVFSKTRNASRSCTVSL